MAEVQAMWHKESSERKMAHEVQKEIAKLIKAEGTRVNQRDIRTCVATHHSRPVTLEANLDSVDPSVF